VYFNENAPEFRGLPRHGDRGRASRRMRFSRLASTGDAALRAAIFRIMVINPICTPPLTRLI
jgi:hypothetical protein